MNSGNNIKIFRAIFLKITIIALLVVLTTINLWYLRKALYI